MNLIAWVRAARPPAQGNIAPSLILGQVLAVQQGSRFSWEIFAWLVAFGVLDQLYIVFANDVADIETDRLNRTVTPFSGGSRVVPEGALTARSLAIAAVVCAALLCVVGGVLASAYARPLAPIFACLALALLWAYSYRPLRLSYRGGGEVLQMIGIGVVLPTLGYYAQAGTLAAFPWPLLLATLPLQLAGAVATALPDAPSDACSGKKTLAVLLGQGAAQRLAVALQFIGAGAYLIVSPTAPTAVATWSVIAIPLLAAAAQIALPRSMPGDRSMLWRVLLILSANAAFTIGVGVVALA